MLEVLQALSSNTQIVKESIQKGAVVMLFMCVCVCVCVCVCLCVW